MSDLKKTAASNPKTALRLTLGQSHKIVKSPTGPKPDLSVVVIALNEEKRIVQCLESLRNQSFQGRVELILADGMSEDRTVELALPLVDGLILEKNRNCAFERNAGSLLARADIIAFCDSDSIVDPNWAKSIMNSFERDPKKEIAGVFGVSGTYDASGPENVLMFACMALAAWVQHVRGHFFPANSNYAFRKSVWEKLDGMDVRLTTCEDHEFFGRVAKEGKLAFNPSMKVFTSARRIKKLGYIGFLRFQLSNADRFYKTGSSTDSYENIR